MPVKGLLITLDEDPDRAAAAQLLMSERTEIELGELNEKWQPLVMDTPTEASSKELYRWIESLDGVYFVDTVFSSVDGPVESTKI